MRTSFGSERRIKETLVTHFGIGWWLCNIKSLTTTEHSQCSAQGGYRIIRLSYMQPSSSVRRKPADCVTVRIFLLLIRIHALSRKIRESYHKMTYSFSCLTIDSVSYEILCHGVTVYEISFDMYCMFRSRPLLITRTLSDPKERQ